MAKIIIVVSSQLTIPPAIKERYVGIASPSLELTFVARFPVSDARKESSQIRVDSSAFAINSALIDNSHCAHMVPVSLVAKSY